MPTGYTAMIKEDTTFKEFATRCMRGFGACLSMRDEPLSKEIPVEFKPRSYHKERAEEAKKELKEFRKLRSKELEELKEKEIQEAIKKVKDRIETQKKQRNTYNKMLRKAKKFCPPSVDHIEFRRFMIEQIVESIRFDCDTNYSEIELKNLNTPKKFIDWYDEKIEEYQYDIKYHENEYEKEVEGCKNSSEWINLARKAIEEVE